jgi:hypothetical protein
VSLLQTRRWSNSSGGVVWHCNKRNLQSCFSECKQFRKKLLCCILPSHTWLCQIQPGIIWHNCALSSCHRLLIIRSPQGIDGGDHLTNAQYKPIWKCHQESPLYNEYPN